MISYVDEKYTNSGKLISSPWRYVDDSYSKPYSLSSTQKLLNRGSKLTELLKQNQYSPMTVAQQVIAVFSGVRGFLDDVALGKIKDLEKNIYEKVKSSNPEIIDTINSTGKLDEETEKKLTSVIEAFKKNKSE